MTQAPIAVSEYSKELLVRLFAEPSASNAEAISKKPHFEYFDEYLQTLSVKTIVFERKYIDKDFLDDFAGFYVKCFRNYPSRCARLHFFSKLFTLDDLQACALGIENARICAEELQASYIGFAVVKPLPNHLVGRTCLRPYPPEGRRSFPVTRMYWANLCGLRLGVNSLAFQEQDRVAAACATSALWTVFNATAYLFQHGLYSPTEITRIATENAVNIGRAFPSKGLHSIEMADALKKVGLQPEIRDIRTPDNLKLHVYAYLRAGIPLLLNGALVETKSIGESEAPRFLDLHATAITGFSLDDSAPVPYPETGTLFKANRIDRFYVHDDQVGPFARMTSGGPALDLRDPVQVKSQFSLRTNWPSGDGQRGSILFAPDMLILPLYHKIRLTSEAVLGRVLKLDHVIERLREAGKLPLPSRLEWDVYLCSEAQLKKEITRAQGVLAEERWRLVSTCLPKFIWRAVCLHSGRAIYEFLFDATDFDDGHWSLGQVSHDKHFSDALEASITG